jgi:hypothetical protein
LSSVRSSSRKCRSTVSPTTYPMASNTAVEAPAK